ncbi:hypothetical protein N7509_014270 [Penicillium cosmopolitanum]|uniref:Uncharacterized protein n=1 Tax=Penicillium cosmopolitanum TaxID=1131564 RepID=A0A9W9S4X6_9EURO|nr:uncharacterized protein N7509_014270 [Penicillium cosmopolitanum]KAJ5369658.1 hypothetical protein N7509_014270 [Penicillium cosmopolitanum]
MSTLARSSWGSDSELAYASPILIEAKGADQRSIKRQNGKKHRRRSMYIHDEEGKIDTDGRKRRSVCGSGSDLNPLATKGDL